MISRLFNNFVVNAIAIALVTQQSGGSLSVVKILLVAPCISHKAMLDYLSRKNVERPNIEKLLVERPEYIANFNSRFYDGLATSMNSIQFLAEMEMAEVIGTTLHVKQVISYNKEMGERLQKIEKATPNIATLLANSAADLYSSLRIQL